MELSSNRVIAAPSDEVYLRQGDETVKLSYEQRTQLSYDKGQRFFEDEIVSDATLEDIDDHLVQDFKIVLIFQIVLQKKFSKLVVF